MNTKEIINEILLKHHDISEVKLIEVGTSKDLKANSQSWDDTDDLIFQSALKLRSSHGIPFWSAIMSSMVSLEKLSVNCLDQISRHNANNIAYTIDATDFPSFIIGNNMGINSKVKLNNGDIKHIPMLDFRIKYSDANTALIKYICKKLLPDSSGFLLRSGHSYHFIGDSLVNEAELVAFLGRSLLFTPIVDNIWIAHQLFEGSCTLRLGIKHGVFPTLISRI